MSDRDTNQEMISDSRATQDIGGAYGGEAGTMPDRDERKTRAQAGDHGNAAPAGDGQAAAHHASDAGSGQGGVARQSAPRGAGGDEGRNQSQDKDGNGGQDNLGGNWPGDTQPDHVAREDAPTRQGQSSTSTDAF